MSKKIKILFVRPSKSSFIQRDLALLEEHFNVKVIDPVIRRKNLSGTFKTLCIMLAGILWADIIFSWFAGFHAYCAVRLSRIFRKKSIVVVGGYEVAKIPEIGYGALLYPRSARRVKYVLDNANKILAVSKFNKKEILEYTDSKNVELVYNSVDCNTFMGKDGKEDLVITIGYVNGSTLKKKGLEFFVKSAKYLPNMEFALVGKHVDGSIDYLKSIATPNVEFTGFVSNDELLKYCQRAKVYVQISAHESFGVSLAEAMLCECVPVVTDKGAIPEVVGDTGFYVPYGDPEATAEAIEEALKSGKGKDARRRIKNMFPIEKREKELISEIEKVLK